jgi:gamma-glutamyl-gamma-aminobutyrate hydrolase PuuD
MIEFTIDDKIPTIGVYHGMQFFNKFFGGRMKHTKNEKHVKTRHKIKFIDKKIVDLLERKTSVVNSFHQNLLKLNILAKEFIPFGIVEQDNTVERLYHKKYPIIGVMWNPERESDFKKEFKISENKEIWK